MKNISIVSKSLTIMGAFGLFALAVAGYSGVQMTKIDANYSGLISEEMTGAASVTRAARTLQQARAAMADTLMARDPAIIQKSAAEFQDARQTLERVFGDAIAALPADQSLTALRTESLRLLDQTCVSALRAGSAAVTEADVASAQRLFLGDCQPHFVTLTESLRAKARDLDSAASQESDALTAASVSTVWTTIGIVLAGLAAVLVAAYFAMRAWIVSPITALSAIMARLAGGDLTTEVAGTDRKDEIGGMAKAVQVFKDNGLKTREIERQVEAQRHQTEEERSRNAQVERVRAEAMAQATSGLGEGLQHLAKGDLLFQLSKPFAEEFEGLRADFNKAVAQLRETLMAVAESTNAIDGGAREVSQSAEDLAKRTEQQAASLEETAAALDQITTNVSSSSKRADEARAVAVQANESASRSGAVVANAVDAMGRIEQSSGQISNIIGVIDEIAFQTNLLALNAGVEAARAGEAGKGFAVVAQEVRELAQRSAQAAKEIKDLIRNSTVEVENGVRLVSETGQALKSIESYVVMINEHMTAIATSAREQSVGLSEVNIAVNQMDQVTQQNAAMVEEASAAGATLASESNRLREFVGRFQLGTAASPSYQEPRRTVKATTATSEHRPVASPARGIAGKIARAFGSAAPAAAADTWEEF